MKERALFYYAQGYNCSLAILKAGAEHFGIVISEELEKYRSAEEATKKDELLASADYALIAENQEFKALVADKENYSLEDLTSKCDALLLASVKSQTCSQKNPTRKVTTNIERPAEYKPYGDLFPEK